MGATHVLQNFQLQNFQFTSPKSYVKESVHLWDLTFLQILDSRSGPELLSCTQDTKGSLSKEFCRGICPFMGPHISTDSGLQNTYVLIGVLPSMLQNTYVLIGVLPSMLQNTYVLIGVLACILLNPNLGGALEHTLYFNPLCSFL